MKQNINIEAEGNELILKNKAGDYVIIPKKYRLEVQDMVKENCHSCIDKLVETLPVMEDYAQDGSLLPDWDKNKPPYTAVLDIPYVAPRVVNFEYKPPYTAVQDNTYVAPRVVNFEQKEKQQFVPREQPVLKADTRTDQERKIAREYTESVLNPSISTQIGETFQKPLRWLADPVKIVGDLASSLAPNSLLAKDLPNTNEETFEHRKKQLDPYISNKEKINNTINEAIPLTGWALLNTLPVEAVAGNTVKAGKNLIKPASKVVGKIDDATKAGSKVLNKTDNVVNKVNRYLESPDPNNYYRVIGNKEGYDDLINSGIVRPNQSGMHKGRNTYYTKGNINDKFNPVVSGGAKKNTIYDGEYIVEIKPNNLHFPTDNHGLHKEWNFGLTTAGNEIPYSSEYLNAYKYNKKVKKYELLDKFLNKTDDVVKNLPITKSK